MKLRIRDNSLRLRLTRSEVEKIGRAEAVESSIQLGPTKAHCLSYSLEVSSTIALPEVSFLDHVIRIFLPSSKALAWAHGPEIGIYSEGAVLKILIEKDFFCLKPRSHEEEDESDMFPHPHAASGRCG